MSDSHTTGKLDLQAKKHGSRFRTQDGRIATLIAFDRKLKRPYIFRVGDEVWSRRRDGTHCATCDGAVYPAIVRLI
jgi:hypothetical protein